MMRKKVFSFISLFVINAPSIADVDLPNFFEEVQIVDANPLEVDIDQIEVVTEAPTWSYDLSRRYVGEDAAPHQDSVLKNDFFNTEQFRIYNNTQYSFDEVKNKYINAQAGQINLQDLSISLGYGMEFVLSESRSVGYEYLSAYPYDRGQSIKVFWRVRF